MPESLFTPQIIGYLVELPLAGPPHQLTGFCVECWEQSEDAWNIPGYKVNPVLDIDVQHYDLLCSFCHQSMREKAKRKESEVQHGPDR